MNTAVTNHQAQFSGYQIINATRLASIANSNDVGKCVEKEVDDRKEAHASGPKKSATEHLIFVSCWFESVLPFRTSVRARARVYECRSFYAIATNRTSASALNTYRKCLVISYMCIVGSGFYSVSHIIFF